MNISLNRLAHRVSCVMVIGLYPFHAMAQEAPPQEASPGPQRSVSFAASSLSLQDGYELRKGFGPQAIFPATDHNLYYHAHWPEFIPSHVISRAGGISTLSAVPDSAVAQTPTDTDLGGMSLAKLVSHDDSRIQGIIVTHNGNILYEAYPGMRETDNHIWMSTSKTIVGLLVSLLEEEGKINVTDPIDAYLEEFKGTSWEGIRIIDILDMTTGLDASEVSPSLFDPAHPVNHWQRLVLHGGEDLKPMTSRDAIARVPDIADLPPGHLYHYSSLATQVLGFLVERVEDIRLSDVITDRIWSRMGAEGDATLGLNDAGNAGIFAFMSSRLRDMARYGMLYTPSWIKIAEEQVIPDAVVHRIQAECRPEIYARTRQMGLDAGEWWPSADPDVLCNSRQWDAIYRDGDMYKTGSHGQSLYVSPERDMVVAIFSTSSYDWQDVARAVARHVVPDLSLD